MYDRNFRKSLARRYDPNGRPPFDLLKDTPYWMWIVTGAMLGWVAGILWYLSWLKQAGLL